MGVMRLMVLGVAGWSYHVEGDHRGLGDKIIDPEFPPTDGAGEAGCRGRLGGLLCCYCRDAA